MARPVTGSSFGNSYQTKKTHPRVVVQSGPSTAAPERGRKGSALKLGDLVLQLTFASSCGRRHVDSFEDSLSF